MNPRHTTDHELQRDLRPPSATPPPAGPARDARRGRDPNDPREPESVGTSASDDAYGCVEWFDFEALAARERPHVGPRRS